MISRWSLAIRSRSCRRRNGVAKGSLEFLLPPRTVRFKPLHSVLKLPISGIQTLRRRPRLHMAVIPATRSAKESPATIWKSRLARASAGLAGREARPCPAPCVSQGRRCQISHGLGIDMHPVEAGLRCNADASSRSRAGGGLRAGRRVAENKRIASSQSDHLLDTPQVEGAGASGRVADADGFKGVDEIIHRDSGKRLAFVPGPEGYPAQGFERSLVHAGDVATGSRPGFRGT